MVIFRNLLRMLLIITLFFCSSNEDIISEPQEEPFTVELVATNTNVNIDEVVTFEVKTNKALLS